MLLRRAFCHQRSLLATTSTTATATPTLSLLARFASTDAKENKKTALYDFHVRNKGVMVPFGGWLMPTYYKDTPITKVHKHCRTEACLFDVSHMGQLKLTGADADAFIESLVPGNIKDLKLNHCRLTQFTNENGGVMDDAIVTRKEDHLFIIVNAGCAEQDIEHMRKHMEKNPQFDVQMEVLSGKYSLVALQGPKAAEVLQRMVDSDLNDLAFMTTSDMNIKGVNGSCRVTRCGYTGEDGFEISVPTESVVQFSEALAKEPEVMLAGLGPRDTLRLEAGLNLMGHDMTPDITPIEAGLAWSVGKRRREEGGFPGAEVILKQLKEGVSRTRIGFVIEGKPTARENYAIYDADGTTQIGYVTSGSLSPTLETKTIGLGYVPPQFAKIGTKIVIDIRGKKTEATVSEMPFVPTRYHRKK